MCKKNQFVVKVFKNKECHVKNSSLKKVWALCTACGQVFMSYIGPGAHGETSFNEDKAAGGPSVGVTTGKSADNPERSKRRYYE
jgi:hypothetical protein